MDTLNNMRQNGYEHYRNQEYGISIEKKRDWELLEGAHGTIVSFIIPGNDPECKFKNNFNITVLQLPNPYVTLNLLVNNTIKDLKSIIRDLSLDTNEQYNIGDIFAQKIIYSGNYQDNCLKWLQVIFIKNSGAYVLTYTCLSKEFENYLQEILHIIQTFIVY